MAEPSSSRAVSPVCRYCGCSDEPIVIHGSLICSCGAVLEEVFAEAADYTGWGFSSGRNAGIEGQINTWLTIGKRGGKGPEVSAARKVMAQKVRESELKAFVRALLATLTGEASARHPFLQRVLDTHHQLKLASTTLQQQEQMPKRIATLQWAKLNAPEEGRASLTACVYLVFRESDRRRDVSSRQCYSLQLVASCAQVPFQRALRWFRGLAYAFPDRVEDIKADEPILHVDQIIKWFGKQACLDPWAPSSSHRKLYDDPAWGPSLLLSPAQRKLLSGIADWDQLKRLARSLSEELISSEPLHSAVFGHQKRRVCPGEWAYFIVLWAIGGLVGQRLAGKDWIRRGLVQASLGGQLTQRKSLPDVKGSDSETDYDSGEESGDSFGMQSLPASHISQYAEIGHVISQRVRSLPWFSTLPTGGNRRKKTSGRGRGDPPPIREGEEVRYIKELGEVGIELSRRRARETCRDGEVRSPMKTDARQADKRNREGVDTDTHSRDPPVAARPGRKRTRLDKQKATLQDSVFGDEQLQAAVAYLSASSQADEGVQPSPRDGDDEERRPSWTSVHHPSLALNTSLIDGMSDDVVDALLFTPGEMETYLLPRRDRAREEKIKTDGADGKTTAGTKCAVNTTSQEIGADANADAAKRRKVDPEKSGSSKRHRTSATGVNDGQGWSSTSAGTIPRSSIAGLLARRIKADARLLAAAMGDLSGFVDEGEAVAGTRE